MEPGFEKINERMEEASLNEFMPNFNKEQEWAQLSARLHLHKRRPFIRIWSYAAAILLLAGITCLIWLSFAGRQDRAIAHKTAPPAPVNENYPQPVKKDTAADMNSVNNPRPAGAPNTVALNQHTHTHKNIIHNSTPCPIQIRISQTMKCPDIQPSNINSSSTIEPDQSGPLTYKAHDKIAKNCSLTINEIEIKSIATGETILLNSSSSPSTAQDVFNYITGQKKGDILAGVFNADCNHKAQKHGIRLNNSYGNLVIK